MKQVKCEGGLEVLLKDGATIDISEFRHVSTITISKGSTKVVVNLGRERNNYIEVKTSAPMNPFEMK